MSQEPEVLCPKCGAKTTILVWFTDIPGEGFGSSHCSHCCRSIDFRVRYNKVIQAVFPDPAEFADYGEDLLSSEEYDRELMEYMLEQGLV